MSNVLSKEEFEQYLINTYALTEMEANDFWVSNGIITGDALAKKMRGYIGMLEEKDWDAKQEESQGEIDRRFDLEERGFFDGTDDPYEVERIERGYRFDDKIAMYLKEY